MRKEKNEELHPLINNIKNQADKLGLNPSYISTNSISVFTTPYTGIQLRVEIDNRDFIKFYFTQRTNSWFYNGERTDLHDLISLAFALFLNKLGYCSSNLIDVWNPITISDVEIYSRYIVPIQTKETLHQFKGKNPEIEFLVFALLMFEQNFWSGFNGCPCAECRERLGFNYDFRWQDIGNDKLKRIYKTFGNSQKINYCERTLPTWFYYRNFRRRISFVESAEFTSIITQFIVDYKVQIEGVTGRLFISDFASHYLNQQTEEIIKRYFKKLNEDSPKLIFLESKIVAIGEKVVVTFDELCGIDTFKMEKELIRERHQKEFELLFAPSKLIWNDKVDEELFEELIKDLLEREVKVKRVRKIARTRERDGGVDLIADWVVPKRPDEIFSDHDDPFKIINVVVQCKAYKSGVSKSNVTDIRDTVDYRNYNGFFLAVSSYTKKSLTDYLDRLRTDGKIWVDWWTRMEIEDRLKKHEDLILKYSSIVTYE